MEGQSQAEAGEQAQPAGTTQEQQQSQHKSKGGKQRNARVGVATRGGGGGRGGRGGGGGGGGRRPVATTSTPSSSSTSSSDGAASTSGFVYEPSTKTAASSAETEGATKKDDPYGYDTHYFNTIIQSRIEILNLLDIFSNQENYFKHWTLRICIPLQIINL